MIVFGKGIGVVGRREGGGDAGGCARPDACAKCLAKRVFSCSGLLRIGCRPARVLLSNYPGIFYIDSRSDTLFPVWVSGLYIL